MDKSARGVYYNLSKSPHYYHIKTADDSRLYKFSSKKKKDMFLQRKEKMLTQLDKLYGRIYRILKEDYDYNLDVLLLVICDRVYNDMEYK